MSDPSDDEVDQLVTESQQMPTTERDAARAAGQRALDSMSSDHAVPRQRKQKK